MQARSTLRIIGGKWRSRKIGFIPYKGVRPTTDAMRETLFNWLTPIIVGVNCLDLFAGSGALGFEALSRGARHVVMVDKSRRVIEQLKKNAKLLQADEVEFYCLSIPEKLSKIPRYSFDIIFLDPPFYQDLVKPTYEKLLALGYLAQGTYVYVKSEKGSDVEEMVQGSSKILRKKVSKSIASYLLRVD